MRFFIFINFIFLVLSNKAAPPFNNEAYKIFIIWSKDTKLNWSDFQGMPVENAAEVAMTASSVEYNYFTRGNKIGWKVTPKFYPTLSWYLPVSATDKILQHERLHFDITELYARMLRQQLQNNVHSDADIKTLIAIGKKLIAAWNAEQSKYDIETNHSINTSAQQKWEFSIRKRLDALKEFATIPQD